MGDTKGFLRKWKLIRDRERDTSNDGKCRYKPSKVYMAGRHENMKQMMMMMKMWNEKEKRFFAHNFKAKRNEWMEEGRQFT